MPETLWLIIWLIVQVQCAIGCMVIADSKNLNVGIWAFTGLFFGIIGILMAIGVTAEPERRKEPQRRATEGSW